MEEVIKIGEMAKKLKVEMSTLRKWCLLLEKHEYIFQRDESNRRFFTARDVQLIKLFQKCSLSMKMEDALQLIVFAMKEMEVISAAPGVSPKQVNVPANLDLFMIEADQMIMNLANEFYWRGPEHSINYLGNQWRELKMRFELVSEKEVNYLE